MMFMQVSFYPTRMSTHQGVNYARISHFSPFLSSAEGYVDDTIMHQALVHSLCGYLGTHGLFFNIIL